MGWEEWLLGRGVVRRRCLRWLGCIDGSFWSLRQRGTVVLVLLLGGPRMRRGGHSSVRTTPCLPPGVRELHHGRSAGLADQGSLAEQGGAKPVASWHGPGFNTPHWVSGVLPCRRTEGPLRMLVPFAPWWPMRIRSLVGRTSRGGPKTHVCGAGDDIHGGAVIGDLNWPRAGGPLTCVDDAARPGRSESLW